jgi:hypothetical protein
MSSEDYLFPVSEVKTVPMTSSEKHKKLRKQQAENSDRHHHPEEKIKQLETLAPMIKGDILEVFAGKGNLTKWYEQHGNVTAMSKETTGDSFNYIYELRAKKKKYDVIDIDGYGYPDKFFPVVFEMMKPKCLLIFTFPMVGVQCVNGIYEMHYAVFWKSTRPSIGDVVGGITDMAMREWTIPSLVDVTKMKPILRFAFMCERKKATELCNVRNR